MLTKLKALKSARYPGLSEASDDDLEQGMVSLFVGPEEKLFTVPKDLLCERVKYFDRMFNGPFEEGTTQCAYFPEDKASAFEILLHWVDQNGVPSRERHYTEDRMYGEGGFEMSWNAFDVYNLADKLLLPVLKDMVMDSMRHASSRDGSCTKVECMIRLYDEGTEITRRYLASLLHWMIVAPHITQTGAILSAMQENEELGNHILRLMRDTNGKEIPDPREGDDCDFHCHAKGEECIAKQLQAAKDAVTTASSPVVTDPKYRTRKSSTKRSSIFGNIMTAHREALRANAVLETAKKKEEKDVVVRRLAESTRDADSLVLLETQTSFLKKESWWRNHGSQQPF